MRKLTQAIFDDAPDWVKSAAIDSTGDVYLYSCKKTGLCFDASDCWWVYRAAEGGVQCEPLPDIFDATDWRNSAIDREVAK